MTEATDEMVEAAALAISGAPFSTDKSRRKARAALTAALAVAPKPSVLNEIAAERQRQVSGEGWTLTHDDQHHNGEMAYAAAWYAINAESHDYDDMVGVADFQNSLNDHFKEEHSWCRWPWSMEWWKPKNRRRDLVRAAALIVAEIERLDRSERKVISGLEDA